MSIGKLIKWNSSVGQFETKQKLKNILSKAIWILEDNKETDFCVELECGLFAIILSSRFSLIRFSIEALKQKLKATHNRTIYSHVLQLFRPNQAMQSKEGLKGETNSVNDTESRKHEIVLYFFALRLSFRLKMFRKISTKLQNCE